MPLQAFNISPLTRYNENIAHSPERTMKKTVQLTLNAEQLSFIRHAIRIGMEDTSLYGDDEHDAEVEALADNLGKRIERAQRRLNRGQQP